jgi:hypothetical protein
MAVPCGQIREIHPGKEARSDIQVKGIIFGKVYLTVKIR